MPLPTIVRVSPVGEVKLPQLVGKVPGVPATAPTIVLLVTLFVLLDVMAWSKRGAELIALVVGT